MPGDAWIAGVTCQGEAIAEFAAVGLRLPSWTRRTSQRRKDVREVREGNIGLFEKSLKVCIAQG